MILINVESWADFKQICITRKNLSCQYDDGAKLYDIYGPDSNGIVWRYGMAKATPPSDDQVDFETNYKANFNYAIGGRSYPFATGDFDYFGSRIPVATISEWTAGDGDDSYADLWFKIEASNIYMNGGELTIYSGFVAGDWAEMALVDKDGVYGPEGTVLKTWVPGKNMRPGSQAGTAKCHCHTPYAGNPPINCYVRIRLHRADTGNRVAGVNLEMHRSV